MFQFILSLSVVSSLSLLQKSLKGNLHINTSKVPNIKLANLI